MNQVAFELYHSSKGTGILGSSPSTSLFVFNPLATSNNQITISTCFRSHDREKCHVYEQRAHEVEQGSFTTLVFSALGGVSRPTEITYKRLASLLATKKIIIISFIRCRLSFSLLRSAIMCLRGSHSTAGRPH